MESRQRRSWVSNQRAPQAYISPYNVARNCARHGESEQTLLWLEKAYKEHADHLVLLKVDPICDGLRTDPRFGGLLRRIGLTS